jgi:hypothetical protein
MIRHTRIDKDGFEKNIEIKEENLYGSIRLTVFDYKVYWLYKVKNILLEEYMGINECIDFTCEDFSRWSDEAIETWNHKKTKSEKRQQLKDLINNSKC